MEPWLERMSRSGGSIACLGNCPVHTACGGAIRPLDATAAGSADPIDGHRPLARCDACSALFGFEQEALHFLDHPASWRQSPHEGKPPGIP